MTGDDIEPTSETQTTFSLVSGSHVSGRFFSRLMPFCSGPRHWYQPFTRAVCGAVAGSNPVTGLASAALATFGASDDCALGKSAEGLAAGAAATASAFASLFAGGCAAGVAADDAATGVGLALP